MRITNLDTGEVFTEWPLPIGRYSWPILDEGESIVYQSYMDVDGDKNEIRIRPASELGPTKWKPKTKKRPSGWPR